MKTSTLCTGSLSLVLLAAGAAGLADASAGPMAEGVWAWSPLAAASDAVAAWITPGAAAEASLPLPVRHKVFAVQAPRPAVAALAAAMPAPAVSVRVPATALDCKTVIPDWDCEDWRLLNAETVFEKFPCMEIRVKRPVAPRGHWITTRVSSPRQRA